MPDLITLTCPTCGAKLKVTDPIHLLACRNCGNEHMVVRDASSIYLAPLAQDVRGIRVGVDKTAAELAVARLTKEVADLNATLASTKAKRTNEWIAPTEWETLLPKLMIGALILTPIVGTNVGSGSGGFVFVLAVAFIILYTVISNRRSKRADAMQAAEVQRLQSSLNNRTAALAKNRQIAES